MMISEFRPMREVSWKVQHAENVQSGSILKIQMLFLNRSPAALMLSAVLLF
jgi:hypothetical protein